MLAVAAMGCKLAPCTPALPMSRGMDFRLNEDCCVCLFYTMVTQWPAATAVWVAANFSVLYLCVLQPAVPVWRQVRRMCDNSPECTRALRAQVQELQQEVARLWRKVPAIMLDEACHERDAADFEFESDSWDESDSLEED